MNPSTSQFRCEFETKVLSWKPSGVCDRYLSRQEVHWNPQSVMNSHLSSCTHPVSRLVPRWGSRGSRPAPFMVPQNTLTEIVLKHIRLGCYDWIWLGQNHNRSALPLNPSPAESFHKSQPCSLQKIIIKKKENLQTDSLRGKLSCDFVVCVPLLRGLRGTEPQL